MKLPRFTLRELFLVVVIAAMGCGWWVEHRSWNRTFLRLHWEADKWKGRAYGLARDILQPKPGQWIEWNPSEEANATGQRVSLRNPGDKPKPEYDPFSNP